MNDEDDGVTDRCDRCGDATYERWEFPWGSGIDLCYECYWQQADEEPPKR